MLTTSLLSAFHNAAEYPNGNIIGSYGGISIFQDGGRCGAILFPVSDWVTSLSSEVQYLSAYQIGYRQDNSIHSRDISVFEE